MVVTNLQIKNMKELLLLFSILSFLKVDSYKNKFNLIENQNSVQDSIVSKKCKVELLFEMPINHIKSTSGEQSGFPCDFSIQGNLLNFFQRDNGELFVFDLIEKKLIPNEKINNFIKSLIREKKITESPRFCKISNDRYYAVSTLNKIYVFDSSQYFIHKINLDKGICYHSFFNNSIITWQIGRKVTEIKLAGNYTKKIIKLEESDYLHAFDTRFTERNIFYDDSDKYTLNDTSYTKEDVLYPPNPSYMNFSLYATTPSYYIWFDRNRYNKLLVSNKSNNAILCEIQINEEIAKYSSSYEGDASYGVRIAGYDDHTIYLLTTNLDSSEKNKVLRVHKISF
jgi:hypothetical protein